jgi:uncharacterized membrane protein YphA (DoxX/SURF4 family)
VNGFAVVLELFLASSLLVAASQKLLQTEAWRASRVDIAPDIPVTLWRSLPFVETLVGVGLAIGFRPWAGVAAVALFGMFGIVLAIAYRNGVRADCNCFGAFLPTKVGPVAIGRAIALALMSVALVRIGDPAAATGALALSVPLTVTALVSLYGTLRPMLSR